MSAGLSLSGYAAAADSQARRRRLSQAVASRLIGWRTSQTQQLVVEQAKSLCGKYLRAKLRGSALIHKKLGLQRLKSVSHLPWSSGEVSAELRELANALERSHPDLFGSVLENVGLQAVGSEAAVQALLAALATQLFHEVSWGRVAALYAVAGALAVDCVKLGRPELVLGLVQAVGACVEGDLSGWIVQQGGWCALVTRFKKPPPSQSSGMLLPCVFFAFVLFFFYYLVH